MVSLVQLNKCVVVCGSVLQMGHSGDGCLSSTIVFKYECRVGLFFNIIICSGKCCFRTIYVEWYGVCNFVVISVVEICVDYRGLYVFYICIFYGVVVCVDIWCSLCC